MLHPRVPQTSYSSVAIKHMFMLYVVFFLISNGHIVLTYLCTYMTYIVWLSTDGNIKKPLAQSGISIEVYFHVCRVREIFSGRKIEYTSSQSGLSVHSFRSTNSQQDLNPKSDVIQHFIWMCRASIIEKNDDQESFIVPSNIRHIRRRISDPLECRIYDPKASDCRCYGVEYPTLCVVLKKM